MKKITIIALHLGVGGVENSIISLSNMLCEKYSVKIISTYKLSEEPAFKVDNRVEIEYLLPSNIVPNRAEFKKALKDKKIFSIIKEGIKAIRVLILRKTKMIEAIKKIDSDIVISTRAFHNRLLGKYGKNIKIKIAQEHNYHNNDKKYINEVVNSVKKLDYLMPVSKELTEFYAEKLKETKIKCKYIPHCIDIYPTITSNLTSNNIVAVGRLAKEKGYTDMISIFAKFSENVKGWNLLICGDGSEYENINNKITELHLEGKAKLLGFKNKDELNKILLDSSIYLMTSYTESFGLVLIDAESYGIPLVAFDSARGATEIIDNNQNGFLIENRDMDKMVDTLTLLANDKDLRLKLGKCGREKSEFYKKENVSKMWYDFIDEIVKEN